MASGMATTHEHVEKAPIALLPSRHREAVTRAVKNVLSTEIAQTTFAQVIDGLPIAAVLRDTYDFETVPIAHPLNEKHQQLCSGIAEMARRLWSEFDLESLKIGHHLLRDFQSAAPGSRAFQTRLVEVIAVVVHQIAVYIVGLDISLHKDDKILTWAPSKDEDPDFFWSTFPDGPPPTLFLHRSYRDYDQYPDGAADAVGYWAEARILGGVVLFDRRDPDQGPNGEVNPHRVDPDAVYFHADREEVTYRIFCLTDTQKQALAAFLLSESEPPTDNPLPILGDETNRQRVDPEEALIDTGIYRDVWERKLRLVVGRDARQRDVMSPLDHLTREDFRRSFRRGLDRNEALWKFQYGEGVPE